MGKSKILNIAAASLTAAGAIAGGISTVTNVVEIINVEKVHEITETDVYRIAGEEVTEEEYLAYVENIETVYYGAVEDVYDIDLDELESATVSAESNTFIVHIDSGFEDPEREAVAEHPVFAVPSDYEFVSWRTTNAAVNLSVDSVEVDGLTAYFMTVATYDFWNGGYDYVITFMR